MYRSNKFILIFIITLVFAAAASAQTMTTYVAANTGNDANACDEKAPCKTIKKGLSVTLPDGKVTLTESGTYDTLYIDKPVTIAGADGVNATIVASNVPFSVVVSAPTLTQADAITFRNIHFMGTGTQYGIYTVTAGTVNVDNCTFTGLNIGVFRDSNQNLFVHNSTFRNNTAGILAQGLTDQASRMTIDASTFESNGYGLQLQGKVIATVRNTVFANNSNKGVWVRAFTLNQNGELLLDNCEFTHNTIGMWVLAQERGAEIVRLSRSTFTNSRPFAILMTANTTVYSLGDNVFGGNFQDVSGGVLTPLAAK
jgi:hypothetical protein